MKNSQQPAFAAAACSSSEWTPEWQEGFTKLEQTCIQLGVAKTGDPELDAIIREANRRDLAAKAMQGLIAGAGGLCSHVVSYGFHKEAVTQADALIAELESTNQQIPIA